MFDKFIFIKKKHLKRILMGQKQLAQDIQGLTTQVTKVFAEVSDIKTKLDNVGNNLPDDVSPELQSAFDELKAQVQKVDDLIPDAAPEGDQPPQ
jgi:uncharacterized protein YoxC